MRRVDRRPARRPGGASVVVVTAEIEHAREIVAAHDVDDTFVQPRSGAVHSLRWVLLHMVEEYARHCGHADLLRERIDGVTGY